MTAVAGLGAGVSEPLSALSAVCPDCGIRLTPPAHVFSAIESFGPASLPHSMPAKAQLSDWSADPHLCLDCPTCGSPLQFNPFGVGIEDPDRQLRREVEVCIALLGPTHRNTLSTRLGLAAMLEHPGREVEAQAAYADLAETCAEFADEPLSAADEVIATLISRAGDQLDPAVVQALTTRIEATPSRRPARQDA